MMFFLLGDTTFYLIEIRLTHRKNAVAGLPMEIVELGALILDPLRNYPEMFNLFLSREIDLYAARV
jgi:hypothetical protein